jgi:hypothetical protein
VPTVQRREDRRQSAGNMIVDFHKPKKQPLMSLQKTNTNHDSLAKCRSRVDICDTWMDMHLDRITILHKNLLQQHSRNLARLDVGEWDKMSLWSFNAGPAETKPLFF